MSAPIVFASSVQLAFGASPELFTLPILNLPPGALKVRRRLRNDDFAQAFVKTVAGVTHHSLAHVEGGLHLVEDCVQGANHTDPQ